METILKNCLNCTKEFSAPAREVKRGNGKFCCLKCACEYNGKVRLKPQPNTECAWCHKPLYRNTNKASRSKSGLFFCCDDHKNQAQGINGLKQMHLPNYGTGKNYRYKTFNINGKPKKCERCGWDEHEAGIVVHHKDHDHDNNNADNLEVLCAICHAIEHWGRG